MSRPFATVSVDVDPVDLHLVGYGYDGLPPDPLAYTRALPRLAELFARHRVRATLFVVGRDAAANAGVLRELEAAGHEIASHSLDHPMPFVRVPMSRLRHQLAESKRLLDAVLARPVVGFRAPNWDVSPRALAPLADAGYLYDASGFPSLFQVPVRLLLLLKSDDKRKTFRMRPWPWTLRRRPFRWRRGTHEIVQFPISVSRWVRFPLYHTTMYLTGQRYLDRQLDGFVRRGETFFYPLHAVDALGLREDTVDARLARHPGLEHPLEAKLAMLDARLAAISARFECVPYRDLLERGHLA